MTLLERCCCACPLKIGTRYIGILFIVSKSYPPLRNSRLARKSVGYPNQRPSDFLLHGHCMKVIQVEITQINKRDEKRKSKGILPLQDLDQRCNVLLKTTLRRTSVACSLECEISPKLRTCSRCSVLPPRKFALSFFF